MYYDEKYLEEDDDFTIKEKIFYLLMLFGFMMYNYLEFD